MENQNLSIELKADLFDWLVGQMKGEQLIANGTALWKLPSKVTMRYRASTPMQAVLLSYGGELAAKAKDSEDEIEYVIEVERSEAQAANQ